MLTTAIAYNGL